MHTPEWSFHIAPMCIPNACCSNSCDPGLEVLKTTRIRAEGEADGTWILDVSQELDPFHFLGTRNNRLASVLFHPEKEINALLQTS
jgi:hypothetical protein